MENRVWVILRPHYSALGKLQSIGICGAGFFINKNIFITSYHILNETSFMPNAFYFNKNIFLVNPEGKKIEITSENIYKLVPEIDITIIKTSKEENYSENFFEFDENYLEGEQVKNIGYPESRTEDIISYDFNSNSLYIKRQFEQQGKILKCYKNYSINANDVKIFNKKVIILDYTSESGFSGGPLLKNGKVIGIMSHLYPVNKNAVAISIEEIKNFLVQRK
jgi:V8-like Glu-specific endopeptidase